jgi:hypothetical protein
MSDLVVIIVVGAAFVLSVGELWRRAVLGRRLEYKLAKVHATPAWRVLRSESDISDAVARAIGSELASTRRSERIVERYEALQSASVVSEERQAPGPRLEVGR